jgi:ribosomal subunit interface protein
MDIQIKGTKYEPTPEILAIANRKVGALERFLPEGTESRAYLELEQAVGNQNTGDIWRAELTIEAAGAKYRAESTKAKLDHAIVTVVRDVGDELRKHKRKEQHLVRRGGSMVKAFLRGFGK